MKKKTKEWIKDKLLNYLDVNDLTIVSGNWNNKKGIGERASYFKSHYDDSIEEYLTTKFHLQCEESETKLFFKYLLEDSKGNEENILDFFKNKSPANKTKIEKNGEVKIENTSNDYYNYQKYMTSLLDEEMLFNYVGNLKFLGSEQGISFELIENIFDGNKREALIEMYLNSNLMKNIEFERKLYVLLEKIELKDKYIQYFPNLKEGKKDFSIRNCENKETNSFIISFDKEILVQQIEVDKSMSAVYVNIDNIVNLKKIKELNIEHLHVLNQINKKLVMISGDDLNIDYIKVAITEYMRISLKEETQNFSIVSAPVNFDEKMNASNNKYIENFEIFKEKIQKIYLKEKLDKILIKDNTVKSKTRKI